jgi:hypothetical protein
MERLLVVVLDDETQAYKARAFSDSSMQRNHYPSRCIGDREERRRNGFCAQGAF